MYGFDFIVNGRVNGDISYNNINCFNRMITKFKDDKIFEETDCYIIILDGVVTNKIYLMNKYRCSSWIHTVISMYNGQGETFFSEFRGSFSGVLVDKNKANKTIIFSDHIGSRFTYYAQIGDFLCVTEELGHIYTILRDNEIHYSLSIKNAYFLLIYGYMVEEKSLCDLVKKIQPGCYLVYQDNTIEEKRYFMLNNSPEKIDEDDAIEMIDMLFRKAISEQFEKDKEYGYNHLVSLSGGLDSRMTTYVAHDMGYKHQLNITFSQSDYLDSTIAREVAEDLNHEWLFRSLDTGLWLLEVDKIIESTGGSAAYTGAAHSDSLFKLLDFNKLGLLHTGQLGDGIIGTFVTLENENDDYIMGEGAETNSKINRLPALSMHLKKEMGFVYYRYLSGANSGLQFLYNYTESLSPFSNIEFFNNVLKIPISLRYKHYIYKKWINKRYPGAAKYVWEKIGRPINTETIKIFGREIPVNEVPLRIIQKIGRIVGVKSNDDKKNMNPLGYYYNHNAEIRNFFNNFKYNLELVKDPILKQDIEDFLIKGSVVEKIQAITLLSAIKKYFAF